MIWGFSIRFNKSKLLTNYCSKTPSCHFAKLRFCDVYIEWEWDKVPDETLRVFYYSNICIVNVFFCWRRFLWDFKKLFTRLQNFGKDKRKPNRRLLVVYVCLFVFTFVSLWLLSYLPYPISMNEVSIDLLLNGRVTLTTFHPDKPYIQKVKVFDFFLYLGSIFKLFCSSNTTAALRATLLNKLSL